MWQAPAREPHELFAKFMAAIALNAALVGAPLFWLGGPSAVSVVMLSSLLAALEASSHVDRHRGGDTNACLPLTTGLLLLLVVYATGTSSSSGSPIWIGLSVGGIALRVAAIRKLKGRFVTDVTPVGELETTGIYAWIRHPSETGTLLFALGLVGIGPAPIAWILLLGLTALVVVRVRIEDRALLRIYDEQYRRYRARVRALI